jgi:transcriptional regulator with XRE-family HTH domain
MENKTTEYGLTVASVSALSCQALSIELFNIMDSIRQGNKSAWEIAKAYSRIVNEELFDEDFDTLKEFAEYVGVSPATITQYCKAVELIDSQPDMNEDMFTVGTAYLLSTLGEELGEFIAYEEAKDNHVENMSVAFMKSEIQKFKHRNDEPVEESEESEESENTEETEDTVEAEEIDKDGHILLIIMDMEKYGITLEDIASAMNNR